MRYRIRNIMILMSVCILGIYFFQGYWIYRTYRIRREEFGKEINDALRTAVFNKQFNDMRRILGFPRDRDRRGFDSPQADSAHVMKGFLDISDSTGRNLAIIDPNDNLRRIYLRSQLSKGKRDSARLRVLRERRSEMEPEDYDRITQIIEREPGDSAITVHSKRLRGRYDSAVIHITQRFAGRGDEVSLSFDTALAATRREGDTPQDPRTLRVYADSMAQQISDLLILNNVYKERFSVKRLDSIYRQELKNRNIYTSYKLDTFQMNFAHMGREGFRDSLRLREPLQTPKIAFNPFGNLFVQATFEAPVPHILRQMLWILVASLALLLLTTTCFLYMMRTILKQKRLSEVKNDFINNMTHELKTPIATVYAAVEAMQNFNALNDQRKTSNYLDISKQELQRLSDLVEKVLHIASEEKEDFDLFLEDTDVNEMIENTITNHQLKAGKPVNFHFEPMEDAVVLADRTHLSNAISNLVDNAIKYSKEKADITITVKRYNNRLTLRVKDQGIGIPKVYRDNIFEKFFRVPTGNLHNVKGFGLGLSYVKKIVEKHEGTITVYSEQDRGSEFIIDIPA